MKGLAWLVGPRAYLLRASLFKVRRAAAATRRRCLRPLASTSVTLTRLSCHLRLVWRWECETLFPVIATRPVSSHLRAISSSYTGMECEALPYFRLAHPNPKGTDSLPRWKV